MGPHNSVHMDPEGPDAGLWGGLVAQRECFFRAHRKTNKTRHCPSSHPKYLLSLTCSWTSNWKVIPEQLFFQMSHLEIQQKTNLVLFQSNTCPHIATHTCSGSIHFTQITSQTGITIIPTEERQMKLHSRTQPTLGPQQDNSYMKGQ